MNVKRILFGTTAALATMALVGCGTATNLSSSQPGAPLTKANFAAAMTAATTQAKSVHVNGDVTVQGQHLTLTVDESKTGDTAQDIAAQATISLGGLYQVQLRIVGGDVYLNKTGLPIMQGVDKPWVKLSLTDSSNPLGAMFGRVTSGMSPAALAKTFSSISTLTNLGPATIDTTATTHYQVTIDVSKAASTLGLPPGTDTSSLPKTLSYDVWLDSLSRPVMISMVNPKFSMNMTFSKWGEPVHVVAPPASQVGTYTH